MDGTPRLFVSPPTPQPAAPAALSLHPGVTSAGIETESQGDNSETQPATPAERQDEVTHVLYIDMASEQLAILEAGEDIPNRYFGLTFVEQGTAAECIAAAREYASRMTEPYCIGFSLATEASR